MVFTGSYRVPTTVLIPGQIAYPADNFNRVFWGEDIPFTFPDPTAPATYKLVICESQNPIPIIVSAIDWAGDENEEITFTVLGGEAKELLPPGNYFFSMVRFGDGDPATGFVMMTNGSFHVVEVPGSAVVDDGTVTGETVDPANINLHLYRGTVFGPIILRVKNEGAPADLTGYTPYAYVEDADGNLILDLLPVMVDPTTGEITLTTISSSVTPDYPEGEYNWDLVFKDESNEVYGPIFYGTFVITTAITGP